MLSLSRVARNVRRTMIIEPGLDPKGEFHRGVVDDVETTLSDPLGITCKRSHPSCRRESLDQLAQVWHIETSRFAACQHFATGLVILGLNLATVMITIERR